MGGMPGFPPAMPQAYMPSIFGSPQPGGMMPGTMSQGSPPMMAMAPAMAAPGAAPGQMGLRPMWPAMFAARPQMMLAPGMMAPGFPMARPGMPAQGMMPQPGVMGGMPMAMRPQGP